MTQRFGRNKRRAARLAVETAEANREQALRQAAASREADSRSRRLLAEIAERITMALGDDSALLPIEMTRLSRLPPHHTRHPIRRDVDRFPIGGADFSMMTTTSLVETSAMLFRLVTHVEFDPIRFAKLIRFRNESYEAGFSTRAMMISEDTLRTIGLRGSDIDYLAREIAQQLAYLPPKD